MTEKEAKKIVKDRNKKVILDNLNGCLYDIFIGLCVLPLAILCVAVIMWPFIVKLLFTIITGDTPIWVNVSLIVWFSLTALCPLGAYLICTLNSKRQYFLKQVKEELELDEKRQQLMPKIIQRLISDGYDVGGINYSLIKTWSCNYSIEYPVMCLIKNNNTKEEFEHWLHHLDYDMEMGNE